MKNITGIAVLALAVSALAAEKKIEMKDLPDAVREAVARETKGATVQAITTEMEHGKKLAEVETTVDGHGRDVAFDSSGALLEAEEETALEKVPAAAREAITRHAGSGKIGKVETITRGDKVLYEAAIKSAGRTRGFTVDAQGHPAK